MKTEYFLVTVVSNNVSTSETIEVLEAAFGSCGDAAVSVTKMPTWQAEKVTVAVKRRMVPGRPSMDGGRRTLYHIARKVKR